MTLEIILRTVAWIASAGLASASVHLVRDVGTRRRMGASGHGAVAAPGDPHIATFYRMTVGRDLKSLSEADIVRIMAAFEDELHEGDDGDAGASARREFADLIAKSDIRLRGDGADPPVLLAGAISMGWPLRHWYAAIPFRLRRRVTRQSLPVASVVSEPTTAAQPFIDGVGHTFSFGLIPLNSSPIRSIVEVFSGARSELEATVRQARRSGIVPPHVSGSN